MWGGERRNVAQRGIGRARHGGAMGEKEHERGSVGVRETKSGGAGIDIERGI